MSVPVNLNGEPRDLPDGSTVAQAVAELTAAPSGVAAAVNGEVVPRGSWAATPLRAATKSRSSRPCREDEMSDADVLASRRLRQTASRRLRPEPSRGCWPGRS